MGGAVVVGVAVCYAQVAQRVDCSTDGVGDLSSHLWGQGGRGGGGRWGQQEEEGEGYDTAGSLHTSCDRVPGSKPTKRRDSWSSTLASGRVCNRFKKSAARAPLEKIKSTCVNNTAKERMG